MTKNQKPSNCRECRFSQLCLAGVGTCKKTKQPITAYDWCNAGRKK